MFSHSLSRGGLRVLASLATSLLLAVPAYAVAPNLTAIMPAGGQRGTTVEVTLRGERLEDAEQIFFYGPGITAEKITEAKDKEAKATLTLSPDCRLGEHPFRIRTAGGISPLRIFYVGPFPEVDEKEPNNAVASAKPVAMNQTIRGTIGSEDVDFFSVEAKKNQRLSVEIEGARLGRTLFDPLITILDPTGRKLGSSDDTPLLGHDGYVSLITPADGRYLIQVRDAAYAAGAHLYRLHVGSFPRPAVVFPPGGAAGETLDLKFIGDPAGEFVRAVTLPGLASEKFGVVPERDGLAPSPNWIRVSPLPNAEPVKAAATADNAPLLERTAPLAFNGVLDPAGEAAFFRFSARKSQHLEFQVFARRLGSPLDSVVAVLDAKGKTLGSNDDAAGNPDSSTRVRIPNDGVYTVKVADHLARGGPHFVYRVEIAEVRPALTLSIPDTARRDNETRKSIVVPRDNRFAVLMAITRDSFDGDVAVAVPNLPPGITMLADTVPGSLSAVPVVFAAGADAPLGGNLLTPAGTPVDSSKEVASRFRHSVDWVRIQNDTVYVKSEVPQIAAAVVEEVPFKVRIAEPRVPLVQGGEMTLQIVAERAPGFDEPITVKMLWNPPGVSSLPDMVMPAGSSTVDYKINASNKAEVRKWKTAVVAGATVKGGTAYVSSQLAELDIAAPFLGGKMDLAKVERGTTGRMVCVLEQKIPFEGTAVAQLVGLPDNVTAEPVEFTKESKDIAFAVVTNEKSPLGVNKAVFCRVVITQAAEPITHVIAPGSILRIDAPTTKRAVAALTGVTGTKEREGR